MAKVLSYADEDREAARIVARQNGYFDEKGLTAQLIQMGPQLQVAGVINGELDYVATFQPVVRAVLQGAPLRVVAVLLEYPDTG